MRLIDLFHIERDEITDLPDEPMNPADALREAFGILTRRDEAVMRDVSECLAGTELYFSSIGELLERRGLNYSADAEPWLCVVGAVESALRAGYLKELRPGCSPDEFAAALKEALAAVKIGFSPDKLLFVPQKGLEAWSSQFNEYAGQSGITLYFVEMYGESKVMGAARIEDYAEAAEAAGYAGVKITSRP